MSDNYCYTHMPETTGYCVYCDVEAKGKRIDELETAFRNYLLAAGVQEGQTVRFLVASEDDER